MTAMLIALAMFLPRIARDSGRKERSFLIPTNNGKSRIEIIILVFTVGLFYLNLICEKVLAEIKNIVT